MIQYQSSNQEHKWHAVSLEKCLEHLRSSLNGLSDNEAEQRLSAYGPNSLPARKTRSQIARFLSHFNNILIYVLIVSGSVTLALNHVVDALVIFAVVLANAIIGFLQEGKAERAMLAIQHILAIRAAGLPAVVQASGIVGTPGNLAVPRTMSLLRKIQVPCIQQQPLKHPGQDIY